MSKRLNRTVRNGGQVDAAPRQGQTWYRIVNAAGAADLPAELWLYNEIGFWGVTASDFATDLRAITADSLDVHLNSPGGEVFDGIAIHDALERHPAHVTVHIDALAASAASFIAMAGDEIIINRHGQMMIHNAMGMTFGDEPDHLKAARELGKASETIANMYAERTGVDATFWRLAMADETWYTATEAVEAGLADRVAVRPATRNQHRPAGVPDPRSSRWDLSVYNYAGRGRAPAPRMPAAEHWSAGLFVQKSSTASTVDAASDPLAALKGA